MLTIFNAEDFLTLCLTFNNIFQIMGQFVARVLRVFGIDFPDLDSTCRDIYAVLAQVII